MPRFKVDENLPEEVAALLREHGHDAMSARSQGLAGHPDSALSRVCRSENRTLVTLDTDFANIRAYPPVDHPGIVVLRLDRQDKESALAAIIRLVPLLATEPLATKLWIVESDRVRIWRHGE